MSSFISRNNGAKGCSVGIPIEPSRMQISDVIVDVSDGMQVFCEIELFGDVDPCGELDFIASKMSATEYRSAVGTSLSASPTPRIIPAHRSFTVLASASCLLTA